LRRRPESGNRLFNEAGARVLGGRPAVQATTVHDMLINLGSLGVEGPQLIWR
jgi:hypothetical protein